ncbi:MAG: protease family protein, partial [Fimbriimonadaceae bacterium]|nr:protease family protein [Fimbriimonadaceae bacterium]
FVSAAVIAPFWEEIMFRGTILPALSTVLGRPLWGILLSSFMFAAIHPQGVPLWLGLGLIGGMNAMLAYQTKSLVPSITVHAINNSLVLALGLLIS